MDTSQAMKNLEELRLSCKKAYGMIAVSVIGFFVSMFIIPFCPYLFILTFGFAFLAIPFAKKAKESEKQFQYVYKEMFAKSILQELFGDVTCDWNIGYSELAVDKIGLVQKGNRFSSEDYIRGQYDGVPFEQSDVVIKQVVRSGKHTRTYTYFEGRMFSFDLPRNDIGSVVIFSKSFLYQGNCNRMRHEKIDMESQEFNKNFKVKSINPHDAFYVLTPQIMECIEQLYRKYGNVAMRFIGGKLHVAINIKGNAFNGNYRKPIVYVEEKNKIMQDSNVIIDIVKTLKMA